MECKFSFAHNLLLLLKIYFYTNSFLNVLLGRFHKKPMEKSFLGTIQGVYYFGPFGAFVYVSDFAFRRHIGSKYVNLSFNTQSKCVDGNMTNSAKRRKKESLDANRAGGFFLKLVLIFLEE